MSLRGWIGSLVLVVVLVATAGALAAWKYSSIRSASAAAGQHPEPIESVTVAVAKSHEDRERSTSIGTVIALRSITLRNELAGTVRQVMFPPGQAVEEGAVLVTQDVSVEEAELKAQEAQAVVADTLLRRVQQASEKRAASEVEVDRARADRDIALAQIARIKAIIARKTLRAPFRARVGLADVHPGQYLNEGTQLTTLQGIDDAADVDFTVAQAVAVGLRVGQRVDVFASNDAAPTPARIVAMDARIDPTTRNALVRARIDHAANGPAPGSSVRVLVPVGSPRVAVAVPVSALRKGPGGDHVFVIEPARDGKTRVRQRPVLSGAMLGDDVLIQSGLRAGEKVAASGSFKLRDAVTVAIADELKPAADNSAAKVSR